MPALVAGIHVFRVKTKAWMAGTSPASEILILFYGRFLGLCCPSRQRKLRSNAGPTDVDSDKGPLIRS